MHLCTRFCWLFWPPNNPLQVRKNYERDMVDKDHRKRQMGTALYFIDKMALRAGHEKDEDEADTVGCCTLKVCA